MPETPLTDDHATLTDPIAARHYFDAFARITGHLARVAAELEAEGTLVRLEARLLAAHAGRLAASFRALSLKYLMTGRVEGPLPGAPAFDRVDSGFPVAQELMTLAIDAAQAEASLRAMPPAAELKDRMVRQILNDLTVPGRLQFALSQRLYHEALVAGGLFLPRNDPEAQWVEDTGERRRFLVHWAVYDTQANLPLVYLMDLEDSGATALPADPERWPQAQAHLVAQSLGGLKLLTIAGGFDADFPDLHPKRLRRITLGPMHSHRFTLQSGPIAEVLRAADAPEAEDWALVWTIEDLTSAREEAAGRAGWFGRETVRQIWTLDPLAGAETGATAMQRMMILPERVAQVLAEMARPGLAPYRKFVVGAGGRLVATR